MTRVYESALRIERARQTRTRLVETAVRLLLRDGVARMTVASLANEAGVSPQTVYNSIGGKAEVIKAAYDFTLAGDDDPTPMSERPAFRAIQEAPDIATFAAAYAHWVADIYERVGALLGVLLLHGAGGDPLLEQLIDTINSERRKGNANGLKAIQRRLLAEGTNLDRLVDSVWVLTAPENWHRLVRQRRWSRVRYEAWLAQQLTATMQPN